MTVRHLARRDAGANLVEYGLLIALIALACFAAIELFGSETTELYSDVGRSMQEAR